MIVMKEQMIAIANEIHVSNTVSVVLHGGINLLESKQ